MAYPISWLTTSTWSSAGLTPASAPQTPATTLSAALCAWALETPPRPFEPADDRLLLNEGCGLTTVVARPTASADQISISEFAGASAALKRKIEVHKPGFVAFPGKKAYSAMVDRSTVEWGRQTELFGGTRAWILPNPSGRNRGFSFDELVVAYRELRLAARAGTKRNSCVVGR